jgi:hypothetical protein
LAHAYRSGQVRPQPGAEVAQEPVAAEAAWPAEPTAVEPVIDEPTAGPSLNPSWRAGEAEHTSADAEAGASLDAPEIGDEKPGLEL